MNSITLQVTFQEYIMTMSLYEWIGWFALVLNVWGNYALANKSIPGWIIRLACNIAWIIYSIKTQTWPLLLNHVIFMWVNVYGWHKWKKDIYTCSCGRKYDLSVCANGNCTCELPIVIRRK